MNDVEGSLTAPVKSFLSSPHALLIEDGWSSPASGQTLVTLNPATGEELARFGAGDAFDVDRAVRAARSALESGAWPKMTPAQRAKLLWKLADQIEAATEEFALLESLDNGKPLKDARGFDIPHSVELFRYNAGWATKLTGDSIPLSNPGDWQAYTVREPVGVVGLIVPWNAPLMMAAAKLAPALAAGCTVVLKPAEDTPLTALRLGQLILDVGFPKGVVNIVTGKGSVAGAALVEHPGVDKISFTGSTDVGREIIRTAAKTFKRVTLELGGKTPVIVFPDADLDKAVAGVARGIFTNAGQVCNAGSRLFAHADIFDDLMEGVVKRAKSIKLGSGLDADTEMGPVVSQRQLSRIDGYVRSGLSDGASLLAGGERLDREGYFMAPTVLSGTTADMSVVREEIFGPVLCAMDFSTDTIDDIVRQANASSYGLGAVVWTQNLGIANRMARGLKVGTVRVNGGGLDPALPFGGFKNSGWGRESGRAGIEAYTELKSVAVAF